MINGDPINALTTDANGVANFTTDVLSLDQVVNFDIFHPDFQPMYGVTLVASDLGTNTTTSSLNPSYGYAETSIDHQGYQWC